MAKLALGKARPATFQTTATIPLLDGTKAQVRCTFHNLTRSEYAKVMDEHADSLVKRTDEIRKARADAEGLASGPGFSELLVAEQARADADLALRLMTAWDLDEPLTKESLLQLFDEVGGSAAHLFEACRIGIVEGRLGN